MGIARLTLRDGIGRVNRAPAILVCAWLATLAVSLPLTVVMARRLAGHLGDSLAADSAMAGVNYEWMEEFADQATGIGVTFRPTIIGFGAVLDNTSAFVDGAAQPILIGAAAAGYIALWLFLAGGIIDRYARERETGAYGFCGACGAFFFRFVRLAALEAIGYGLLFGVLHTWLFNRIYPTLVRDVVVERTAFAARLGCYALFGVLVASANLIFDYAKVRAVVEDRRSMVGAVTSACGFIRRNPGAAIGLYAANIGIFVLAIAAYAIFAPGVSGAGAAMWMDFAIAQLYVAGRLWIKLLFWASETALFQSRLAHADYVARPEPCWPDSPIVEAIT